MTNDILSIIWFLGSLSFPIIFGTFFAYAQYEKRLNSKTPWYHTYLMVSGGGIVFSGILYGTSALMMTYSTPFSRLVFNVATGVALLAALLFFIVKGLKGFTSVFD